MVHMSATAVLCQNCPHAEDEHGPRDDQYTVWELATTRKILPVDIACLGYDCPCLGYVSPVMPVKESD